MVGFCIVMALVTAILLYHYEDLIHHDEVTNTTCTFTKIILIDKYGLDDHDDIVLMYKYHQIVTVTKNESLITIEKVKSQDQYVRDREFINQTIPCYLIHNQVKFSYPLVCNEDCIRARYMLYIILISLGLVAEFMIIVL